jgi:hypothetical protein
MMQLISVANAYLRSTHLFMMMGKKTKVSQPMHFTGRDFTVRNQKSARLFMLNGSMPLLMSLIAQKPKP